MDTWSGLITKLSALKEVVTKVNDNAASGADVLHAIQESHACNIKIAAAVLHKVIVKQLVEYVIAGHHELAVLTLLPDDASHAALTSKTGGSATKISDCATAADAVKALQLTLLQALFTEVHVYRVIRLLALSVAFVITIALRTRMSHSCLLSEASCTSIGHTCSITVIAASLSFHQSSLPVIPCTVLWVHSSHLPILYTGLQGCEASYFGGRDNADALASQRQVLCG